MEKFGIYIHWPFCLSKCPYCDFASTPCRSFDENLLLAGYIRDLEKIPSRKVSSIFFGGGTPSMMSENMLEKILLAIKKFFKFSNDIEISLEANPDAIDLQKMKAFKNLGVNRLSMGIQALNDLDLKFLGRIHDLKTALQRIEEMRSVFDNCSIDLIYARPKQNINMWQKELDIALSFDLPHLSLYQLTIEEGTSFYKKGIETAEDTLAIELYLMTIEKMEKNDLYLYEVSNFSKPRFECRHNLLYWQGDDYAGIGPAAHGRLGLKATENPKKIEDWLKNGTFETILTEGERFEEKIMMGLRLKNGMSAKGINPENIKEAVLKGWLYFNERNQWIAPTMEGLLMQNQLVLLLVS